MNTEALSPLSQLPPSNGVPDLFSVPWEYFVQIVLAVTAEAYDSMRKDQIAQETWEEDNFTATLVTKYIRPFLANKDLTVVVICQTPIYTDPILAGNVPARKARKTDIQFFIPVWDYSKVYFAWECKLVGDKRLERRCSNLVSEYVTEGIVRFIDGKYSAEVASGGMLGYVLIGDIGNIVADINQSIISKRRRRHLSVADQMRQSKSVGNFHHVYLSQHRRRSGGKAISLYHLFLSFDFP